MPKGLKIALSILAVGISIPVATIFLTLKNKPVYHTIQPEIEECFVQFTWQSKPVKNLEHLLIFIDKPEDYQASNGLDMFPSEKTDGYVVFPRGVFFNNANILKAKQKIFRMAKKDMRTWIIIKGKAFSAEIDAAQLEELKKLVESIQDSTKVTPEELGKKLKETAAWNALMTILKDKKDLLAKGKLDTTPDRKRSDFMR